MLNNKYSQDAINEIQRLNAENESLRVQLIAARKRLEAYERAEPVAWIEERYETNLQGATIGYKKPVIRHEKPPKSYPFGRKTDLILRPAV